VDVGFLSVETPIISQISNFSVLSGHLLTSADNHFLIDFCEVQGDPLQAQDVAVSSTQTPVGIRNGSNQSNKGEG
jgi:hypothetical protein